MAVEVEKIAQVSIPVRDLDRAVAFYQETLGLQLLFRVPSAAFFLCGGVRIILSVPESPQFDHPSSIFYFLVRDIHASCEAMKVDGVTFLGEPHVIGAFDGKDIWMAFFRDPDDNTHAITSEVPQAG